MQIIILITTKTQKPHYHKEAYIALPKDITICSDILTTSFSQQWVVLEERSDTHIDVRRKNYSLSYIFDP